MTDVFKKFQHDNIHDFYFFTNYYPVDEVKSNVRGVACGTQLGEDRSIQSLVGKLEGKKPLGRCKRRWKDNIKVDTQEVGRDDVDYMDS